MRTRRLRSAFFGLLISMGLSPLPLAMSRTPDVIGRVVSSSNATVEGSPLLANGAILSGDSIKVGEGGSVFLSFSASARAALGPGTSARFSGAKGKTEAQFLAGALSVDVEGKDAFIVTTSTHRFQPRSEGRTEFRVELLAGQRTVVETEQGELAITEKRSGESYTLTEGLLAEVPAAGAGIPGQNEGTAVAIGKAVGATEAIRSGSELHAGESIHDNDLLSTGVSGTAVVQTSAGNQVTLNANTIGRFTVQAGRVRFRMEEGTVVGEGKGEGAILIATPNFLIQPIAPAPSKIYVGVQTDGSTYIESQSGDVRIDDLQTNQAYLLPSGQSVLVPAGTTGIAGLQTLQPANPSAATSSAAPSNPQSASANKPQGHTGLIILGVAGGAGAAAAAALAGGHGGGGSQPVSPSSP